MFTACLPGGRFLIAPMLSSLAVDVLLRGEPGPIKREPRAVFKSMASKDVVEANASLADWLGRLPALELSRLDVSTGTLKMHIDEENRKFEATIEARGIPYTVGIELPSRLEGGYWRTPGVLQMAFWKDQRAVFKATGQLVGDVVGGEVECVVIASDGVRLVTTGSDVPDILLRTDACQ